MGWVAIGCLGCEWRGIQVSEGLGWVVSGELGGWVVVGWCVASVGLVVWRIELTIRSRLLWMEPWFGTVPERFVSHGVVQSMCHSSIVQ